MAQVLWTSVYRGAYLVHYFTYQVYIRHILAVFMCSLETDRVSGRQMTQLYGKAFDELVPFEGRFKKVARYFCIINKREYLQK